MTLATLKHDVCVGGKTVSLRFTAASPFNWSELYAAFACVANRVTPASSDSAPPLAATNVRLMMFVDEPDPSQTMTKSPAERFAHGLQVLISTCVPGVTGSTWLIPW